MLLFTLLTFLPPWLSGLVFGQLGPTTFSTQVCTVYKAIAPITVPMAILGVVLWGIAFFMSPILPDWARQMRGYFMKSMLIILFLGLAPTLIVAVAFEKKCWWTPASAADWCASEPAYGEGLKLAQFQPSKLPSGAAPEGRESSNQVVSGADRALLSTDQTRSSSGA